MINCGKKANNLEKIHSKKYKFLTNIKSAIVLDKT